MRIKALQLLQVEGFPKEVQEWIGKLISPLNDFIKQSVAIVNDGIVFPDNFIGQEFVFSFTYQSDALTLPQSFRWTRPAKPLALQIVAATENDAPVIVLAAWQYTQSGQIQLTQIVKVSAAPSVSALTVGAKYSIRVRVTP